jgi:heme-degrading monooxygenase HmoA
VIARISTYHIQPGRAAEVAEVFRETVLPAARRQVGFRGLLHLVDENDGKAVAISLWESREAALRSESGGYYPTQVANVIPFLSAPPVREFFDVQLDER